MINSMGFEISITFYVSFTDERIGSKSNVYLNTYRLEKFLLVG